MNGVGLHPEIQSKLLKLGNELGLKVWIAQSDKNKEFGGIRFSDSSLKELPKLLDLDEDAKETMRNIDVIWFDGKKIECAFEIEVTTSIYSGVLRLSDLLAIMPNINFPIYIVAPHDRKKEVQQQLLRPTFKHLRLNERCKYIESEDLFQNYGSIVFSGNPKSIEKIATLVKEKPVELESTKPVLEEGKEIWNVFYFDPLDKVPSVTKEDFFKAHKIKALQSYKYIKDSSGEITGIVFQGYKSRIDKHIKSGKYRWDTRRPIRTSNLKIGMQVFVVETDYDLDTGEKLAKPRLRMAGKLKEVWQEKDNEKIEKLFPY